MIPQIRQSATANPTSDAIEHASAYHRDVWTADVPFLLREEYALRRQFGGRRHPGREVAERLAAVEVALMREDAR
ncbi:MAG: hypothetical protein M3Q65_15810 [Chloroflexota bacterium]|nr:hypothetical protein [Chloroflexota bacterium]